jgi:hypothetical protein
MTQNRNNNSLKKQPVETPIDEENRIDWDRKQKSKRQGIIDITEDALPEEDLLLEALEVPSNKKKQTQKKGRHFIYDEDRDAVVVKRKRRRHTDRLRIDAGVWHEWDDES